MARQTRHRNKKRRVKGGGSKTLKNQKITFTLFVGDDGVYLQPPTVSPSIIQSNLKKGVKLDIKDLPGSINSNIREALQDYDMNTFDLTPSTAVSSESASSESTKRPILSSMLDKGKGLLAKSKGVLAKGKGVLDTGTGFVSNFTNSALSKIVTKLSGKPQEVNSDDNQQNTTGEGQ